jgi:hypothetical protein
MTDPDGRNIGRLLDTLVPDLPERPDRLAAIERSVRRRRRWQVSTLAGLAAACVALVLLGMPALLSSRPTRQGLPAGPHQGPGRGTCPAQLPTFPRNNGGLPMTAPGVLAPLGAVRAEMCKYGTVSYPYRSGRGVIRQLILTRDVSGLVTALNELPVKEPLDPCMLLGGGGYLTLGYPDGSTVTIELSDSCGYVRRGDITRHEGYLAVEAFDERYREQEVAAAKPGAVTPAGCPARLTAVDAEGQFAPDPVADLWLRAQDRNFLPAPLAVVTACRYVRSGGANLVRFGQASDRGVAGQTAEAVDASYKAPIHEPCTPSTVRTLDVLVLRDTVGETIEVRVPRDHCNIVIFSYYQGTPNASLLGVLDRLLGAPR